MKHPNATTSLAAGSGVGTLLVYALTAAGVNLPAEAAAALAGAVGSLALLIGRKGFRGLLRVLWRGKG